MTIISLPDICYNYSNMLIVHFLSGCVVLFPVMMTCVIVLSVEIRMSSESRPTSFRSLTDLIIAVIVDGEMLISLLSSTCTTSQSFRVSARRIGDAAT